MRTEFLWTDIRKPLAAACLLAAISASSCSHPVVPLLPSETPVHPLIDTYCSFAPGQQILYYHSGITGIRPDGHYSISPDSAGLWIVAPDGSNPHIILRAFECTAEWAAGGDSIVFEAGLQIYKARVVEGVLDSTSVEQLTFEFMNCYPTWSPDGRQIWYQSDAQNHFSVFRMNGDGSGKTMIKDRAEEPHWLPGGNRILYRKWAAGHEYPDIFTMDPDGQNEIQLTDLGIEIREPKCSPDGTRIVFSNDIHVYTVGGDGKGLQSIARGCSPSWTPDGKQIVFVRYDAEPGKNGLVCIMNADGSGARIITRGLLPN